MMDQLHQVGSRLPLERGVQVRAFLCVRNEAERLEFLLSFYRRAGVDWFFIIDNGSTDHTDAFLSEQPDCTVFRATGAYGRSNYGMDWINGLMDRYGNGHWRLFVDADELLTYPGDGDTSLPALCSFLQANGYEGMYAFMLDLYGEGPISAADYRRGDDFRDLCPLFDPDYTFRDRLRVLGRPPPFPAFEVVGGPRLRRFYPRFQGRGALAYAVPRGLNKLRNSRLGGMLPWPLPPGWTTSPPLLSKLPLTFGAPGRVYVSSHRTTKLNLAPITGVLLHFKFFSDFHQRIAVAIAEGQHFDSGTEYARYGAALRRDPGFGFVFERSARYLDSDDLVRRGLMRSHPDYDAFRSQRSGAPLADRLGASTPGMVA